MSLKDEFEAAVKEVNGATRQPSQDVMLKLYALYKQATQGDASGKRPGMLDVRGRAKYDAWAKRKGTSSDNAMTEYIALAKTVG